MANVLLGTQPVGSIVKLKVGGVATDFIVVHQGRPDASLYDASCDGTWLLMKDCYENKQWDISFNDYESSTIHAYLNNDFLNLIDANIRSQIKQAKIPYRRGKGAGNTGAILSGSNGLSANVFLLSYIETGAELSWSNVPKDGANLDYFPPGSDAAALAKRIAVLNGTASTWLTRSPCNINTIVWKWDPNGYSVGDYCWNVGGIRPALILPFTLYVSDDGTVTTNSAPTTPGNIIVPSSIMGGSTITVSWGTSIDAEGNLAGYKVEKSTDGGSWWSQIYQGPALSTTDFVAFGTISVIYRVKAYDSEGLESGYWTSSQVMVVNNLAPGAPPSITVPNEVKGGASLIVSWAAATDSDGNLSGYILERCINGGTEWTQLVNGNVLSYTDTITKGWTKVMYRVKAYDAYGAMSAYTTSPERTVNNNTAPTITCSHEDGADLGTKTGGFTISYSVDDVDAADTLTVTEKMDNTVKRTFTATRQAGNSFDVTGGYFQKILNGQHTMAISVSDGKASTVHVLTFEKKVTKAAVTLEGPMEADDRITICALSVSGFIPDGANFQVLVTNNARDDEPVWEDCTAEVRNGANHIFANHEAQDGFAFNFRVIAERGEGGTSGYITSVQGGFQ